MIGEVNLSSLDDPDIRIVLNNSLRVEFSFYWFALLASVTLAEGERACAATYSEGGEIAAILMLAVRGRRARALTAPYTTCFGPAGTPAACASLGKRLRGAGITVLRLDALDPRDPATVSLCAGLSASGWTLAPYQHFANWYEPFESLDAFWKARPSRLVSTLRRKRNKLTRLGAQYALAATPAELDALLPAYESVYAASWKEPEPYPGFIPRLVHGLGELGAVRLGVLTLDGTAVAAQIWLVWKGQATIFKLAHREDAAHHSPGTVLTAWMLEQITKSEGVSFLDFGRGDDLYKREWMAHVQYRRGLVAADWRSLSGMRCLAAEIVPSMLASKARRMLKPV